LDLRHDALRDVHASLHFADPTAVNIKSETRTTVMFLTVRMRGCDERPFGPITRFESQRTAASRRRSIPRPRSGASCPAGSYNLSRTALVSRESMLTDAVQAYLSDLEAGRSLGDTP